MKVPLSQAKAASREYSNYYNMVRPFSYLVDVTGDVVGGVERIFYDERDAVVSLDVVGIFRYRDNANGVRKADSELGKRLPTKRPRLTETRLVLKLNLHEEDDI